MNLFVNDAVFAREGRFIFLLPRFVSIIDVLVAIVSLFILAMLVLSLNFFLCIFSEKIEVSDLYCKPKEQNENVKDNVSSLKKRIKYCKNPMEKKKLEQELNALYKEHKRNRRIIS